MSGHTSPLPPPSRSTIGNPFKRKLLRKTRGSRREENGRRKGQFQLGNTSCNSRGKRTTSLQPRAYTLRSILVTPSFSLSFRILNAAFSFKYSRFPRNYRIFNFHRGNIYFVKFKRRNFRSRYERDPLLGYLTNRREWAAILRVLRCWFQFRVYAVPRETPRVPRIPIGRGLADGPW